MTRPLASIHLPDVKNLLQMVGRDERKGNGTGHTLGRLKYISQSESEMSEYRLVCKTAFSWKYILKSSEYMVNLKADRESENTDRLLVFIVFAFTVFQLHLKRLPVETQRTFAIRKAVP